jgi:hypothetical protein
LTFIQNLLPGRDYRPNARLVLLLLACPAAYFLGQHVQRHGTQGQQKIVKGPNVERRSQVLLRLVPKAQDGVLAQLVTQGLGRP